MGGDINTPPGSDYGEEHSTKVSSPRLRMSNYDIDFQLADDGLESLHDNIQYDDSETQDVGRLFVSQPTASTKNRSSEASHGNKKRGRGKTIGKWAVGGVRERVKWGMYGAPVWPRDKCAHYSHFLGSLATDGVYFPIDVKDWRHFDVDNDLGKTWLHIEADTAAKKSKIKKYALERLSDRWKHHKADLKKLYWLPNKGTDERFQCPLSSIDSDQWKAFVTHLDDEDTQTKADINVSNCSQSVMHHSTGTRTFSAVVYEWQVQNGVEEQPDRLEIFKLTHRKKGKTNEYVDPASTKAVQDLEKAEEERRKLNVEITLDRLEKISMQKFLGRRNVTE